MKLKDIIEPFEKAGLTLLAIEESFFDPTNKYKQNEIRCWVV